MVRSSLSKKLKAPRRAPLEPAARVFTSLLAWSMVTVPAPFKERVLATKKPEVPSVSDVALVMEMVLLVAVNGALTRTAPPKTVIGPGMVVAADISIVCVLVDFPRVNPLTVLLGCIKLLGKSKGKEKLVPAGCKVREPVVVTSLVNPETKGLNIKTSPIKEIFAVLLVIPVPALDPNLAPLFCMMIPRVPPSIVIDPELARMSRLYKDTPVTLPAVPVMEIFPPPVARISLGLK